MAGKSTTVANRVDGLTDSEAGRAQKKGQELYPVSSLFTLLANNKNVYRKLWLTKLN